MKPVDQTVDGYPNGNCFAACVASLLEMSIEEMPSIEGKRFYSVWPEWLALHGLGMVDIPAGGGIYIAGYCIASGDSPRVAFVEAGRRTQHAVVCKDMSLIHDPHPSRKFLDGSVKEFTVLYPLEPWVWK